jgi:glycosyltransferase involved in cell wall biosynthesis
MDLHAILLIPSHFESFSLVGLEAAARGMQVIANDVADMNETLAAYATFVDFSDEQAIVGAVEQRLVEFGHKKSQDIRKEHTWDHIAFKLEEVYA